MSKKFIARLTLTILFLMAMYQFMSCMLIAGVDKYYDEEYEYVSSKVGVANYVEVTPEPEYINLGEYKITAYCPCEYCCGKTDGITSTGVKAKAGRTIAVDPEVIPYGSEVVINGHTYIAEDCGGAIKGKRLDMFKNTHQEALNYGVQYADVKIKK